MEPGNDKYRLLIEKLPSAFAYQQIVTDSSGNPVDYIFLDVNSAFEIMTNLSRDKIIGKKVTDVLPDIVNSNFDWIGTYGRVAVSGKDAFFEQYAELLGRCYAVTAYSDEPGYFVTIFHDVTSQKREIDVVRNSEKEQKQLSHYHSVMCEASIALSEAVREQEILDNIAAYLKELTGALAASVSLYDQASEELYLSHHTFSAEQKKIIESLLGVDIFSLKFPITKIQQAEMKKKIVNKPVSVTELTWGSVPQQISDALQEQLEIEGITAVALYYYEDLLGSAVAYLGNDHLDPPDEVLSTFGHIGGLALSRYRGEKALQKSEEHYRLLVENANEGIIITQKGRFKFNNPKVLEIFGCSLEELQSRTVFDFIHPDDRSLVLSRIGKRESREVLQDKYACKIITRSGSIKWIEENSTVIDWEGKTASLSLIEDITERKQAEKKIRYLSFHDNLTELYNRVYLENEMQRLDTERQLPISIIVVDVNGLKLINDTYGHRIGDELLKLAANILKESCRKEDIVARWGGDEFVILLPQIGDKEVQNICKRIKDNCSQAHVKDVPVSLSLGTATKESADITLMGTLTTAEDKMYKNKLVEARSTKNAVVNALLKTLEEKSLETEKHTENMEEMALKLVKKLELSDSELQRLKLLVALHDIGKINIPEQILKKEGSLTPEEWEIIKKHPETGYRITLATEEFGHVAEDILAHHERYDGQGYPRGLKGKEIPLLARITALIDAYEVMTSGRPYKEPFSQEEIIAELKECAGSQFDPKLVELFIAVLQEKEAEIENG